MRRLEVSIAASFAVGSTGMSTSTSTHTLASSLRHLATIAAPLMLAALQTACPGDPPTFPDPFDAAVECSAENLCPTGEVCLTGRCFATCTPTSCGPSEVCGPAGACVPSFDGGPRDAGPVDAPIAMRPDAPLNCTVACDDPFMPVCRVGACVECELGVDCVGAFAPTCDLGLGVCVDASPAICAACNTEADCAAGDVCLTRRDGDEPYERVCVTPCGAGGTCASGFTCETGNCVPVGGATCTSYRLAAATIPSECTDVSECTPLGANIFGVVANARCNAGTCELTCTTAAQCPAPFTTCSVAGICTR